MSLILRCTSISAVVTIASHDAVKAGKALSLNILKRGVNNYIHKNLQG